jgi:uncharacterized protein (TIGR02145 family)
MKTYTVLFLLVFGAIRIFAQNYQINFAGTGTSSSVDSVTIENMTQCKSLTIHGSEILNLLGTVGITNGTAICNNSMSIQPNPMNGSCILNFDAIAPGYATIELYGMTGIRILQVQELLSSTRHSFSLTGIKSGVYILKIRSDKYTYSTKVICNNLSSGIAEIKHIQASPVLNRPNALLIAEKSLNHYGSLSSADMQYSEGDRLKLTGKSGVCKTVVILVPTQSQTVTFNFITCTDADSNNYQVVQIGGQVWMAENLKTTTYRDGSNIPNITVTTDWLTNTTGAYCDYENTPEVYSMMYGRLYNWFAVGNSSKIAPAGWHVATDEEWTTLTEYLKANGYNYDGTTTSNNMAKSMAVACGQWIENTFEGAIGCRLYENNKSGFSALAAGERYNVFDSFLSLGAWWTADEINSTTRAFHRYMQSSSGAVIRGNEDKRVGYSVRCVQD